MEKAEWETHNFIATKMAPLATFAMFAEVESSGHLQLSASNLKHLQRPLQRESMPAKPTPTGREPVLLKVLAEDTDEKSPKSPKRVKQTKKIRIATSLNAFLDEET